MTSEAEIRVSLGLTDEQMLAARKALPDAWQAKGRGYVWTDAGLDTLLDYIASQKEPAGPQTLTVTRIPVNRTVVFAALDGVEHLITHVRNNQLLSPRQLIRAEKKEGRWFWHGPHPTRKGQILIRK